jgi:hypothetical protein
MKLYTPSLESLDPKDIQHIPKEKPEPLSPELPPINLETLTKQYQPFFESTYKSWGHKDPMPTFTPELTPPESLEYKTKLDTNKAEFGRYTLNPDTQTLNLENYTKEELESKTTIADIPESFNGKTLHEVFDYVVQTYGKTHHIPGIEYWKLLSENPDKVPEKLKDTSKYFYFPGSAFRHSDGSWCVPYGRWHGSKWARHGSWLGRGWGAAPRVVLLEK